MLHCNAFKEKQILASIPYFVYLPMLCYGTYFKNNNI